MMIQPQFGEIVGDEEAQTPFELFRDKNMRDEVSELLEVLDDREGKIIYLPAIRVGRRKTENSRRNRQEIRGDQRADPAAAECRPGQA